MSKFLHDADNDDADEDDAKAISIPRNLEMHRK